MFDFQVHKRLRVIATTDPELSEKLEYAWEEARERARVAGPGAPARMELIHLEHRIEGVAMDPMPDDERLRREEEAYYAARNLVNALNELHPQDLRWVTSYGNHSGAVEKLFENLQAGIRSKKGVPESYGRGSGPRPRYIRGREPRIQT